MAEDSKREVDVSEAPDAPDNVPLLFIDGYHGIQLANGVLRFNLTRQVNPPDRKVVVAQLAMGVPVMLNIYNALGGLIRDLEEAGAISRVEEPRAAKDE